MPDINRLNPLKKLTWLPAQNFPLFLQALALLPVVGLVVYYVVSENLDAFSTAVDGAAGGGRARGVNHRDTAVARGGVVPGGGVVDLVWQRHRYTKQLKMSKQEIRDESKETEGNPQMKMRIRRLQRDMLRRQMMKEVPTATAMIVNPTHYAVAIKYSVESVGGAEGGGEGQELRGGADPQAGDRESGADRRKSAAGAGTVQIGGSGAGDPQSSVSRSGRNPRVYLSTYGRKATVTDSCNRGWCNGV